MPTKPITNEGACARPRRRRFSSGTWDLVLAVAVRVGCLAGLGWAPLVAAAPDGGPETDLIQAVLRAPGLTAAEGRTVAARERVDASGRLADLQVEAMASRMVGPMGERMGMWEVAVSQPLPKRGERAADADRARAGVAMAEADRALMAGAMAAEVAAALAEAEGAEARIQLLDTQINRLDAVDRSIASRLATGGGRMADRLTVQSRAATMRLMIEEERTRAADARAAARGWLGLADGADLPGYAAPETAAIDAGAAALTRVAEARETEAEAMGRMARATAKPMTAVGLRFEQERRAMGDAHTVGLAFMTELPVRNRRYARAEARAAEAERAAARTDAVAAGYRIAAALTRVERAERLAEMARTLSSETRDRIHAEFDALVRAAGAGAAAGDSTVLQAVSLLDRATETELQVIRADTAVRVARAELWRHAPVEVFAEPNS